MRYRAIHMTAIIIIITIIKNGVVCSLNDCFDCRPVPAEQTDEPTEPAGEPQPETEPPELTEEERESTCVMLTINSYFCQVSHYFAIKLIKRLISIPSGSREIYSSSFLMFFYR